MRIAALLLFLTAGLAPAQDARPAAFSFRNGFWINLHHFLYMLGQAKPDPQATREAAAVDDAAWLSAVREYRAGLSTKDAVFDKDMIAATTAVANAGDAESLAASGVPEGLRAALERAAPVYRRVFWQRHKAANQARIDEQKQLLERHGRSVGDLLAKVFRQRWPETQKIEMVAWANWAGAYSTDGGLIVFSSMAEGARGTRGLEIVFHEAMHQWDEPFHLLNRTAQRLKVQIPRTLWHSFIFYTAGYAVEQAVPGHKPYAEDMWGRLPGKQALDEQWRPYLEGEGALDQAIERVVKAMAR